MARGKAIINLINLESDEGVATVLAVRDLNEEGMSVVMATRNGVVKRTELKAFANPRKVGIIALTINDDDELVAARITNEENLVFLATKSGKAITFPVTDVRAMGRSAAGVRGIKLSKEDAVVSLEILGHERLETILTVTENGFGKRTPASDYRIQARGGMGLITIKTTQRNGSVVGALKVSDDDQVMLITDTGRIIRTWIKQISVIGRNTQGVKLIDVEPEERVGGVARLEEKEEEEEVEE
jgi:DNA gyrase subunit A